MAGGSGVFVSLRIGAAESERFLSGAASAPCFLGVSPFSKNQGAYATPLRNVSLMWRSTRLETFFTSQTIAPAE